MKYFAGMKRFILAGTLLVIMLVLLSAVVFINKKNVVPVNHQEIVLRDIGHQLLLFAKDSTSRVLPVKRLNDNTYQLSFQHEFGFIPDTLIQLVRRQFKKNRLSDEYIVSVRDCVQNDAVFGFEINRKSGDLLPCTGRTQPVGCYLIEIEFLEPQGVNPAWWLLLLLPACFAGWYMKNKFQKKGGTNSGIDDSVEPAPDRSDNDFLQVGEYRFYPAQCILSIENENTPLSEKEAKALKIFTANLNQLIEREQLMKAIWQDEGIIVMSRNVDVLVSKLRKKLSADSRIKIINVHGRGYKFSIE
jgi:Transcriptional regulatory protein, C terminal